MNIAIVGYATDGRVSAEYFARQGHAVTVCDKNSALVIPEQFKTQLGDNYVQGMDHFDLIVRSSGIHPSVILQANPGVEAKITTSVNEFLRACPTENTIGITGTKGKGTTSTLTTKILEAAGHRVFLGGNIGNSPLEFIDQIQPDDWVVLELSSYQLTDITHSPHIVACLMVVPEHLNWHHDMAHYVASKSRLFEWQSSEDIAVYYAENATSRQIAEHGAGQKLPYFASPGAWVNGNMVTIDGIEICTTDELKLLGKHNWQNVCAALTIVWQAGVHDVSILRQVITSFTGLPHRLEYTATIDGVRYYDDSFGTTPETAIVAIEAFSEPKIIILGGSDKGASYDKLAQVVSTANVRQALLIGEQAQRIREALDHAGFNNYQSGGETMAQIVNTARQAAKAGDVVLLSTACASFDMFRDYKDRGNQFKKAVQSLASAER